MRPGLQLDARRRLEALLLLLLLVHAAAGRSFADASAPPRVQAVDSVAMTVADAGTSAAFFVAVLDFQVVDERSATGPVAPGTCLTPANARTVVLQLGDERLELLEFRAQGDGRPVPADSRANDGWFQHVAIITSDMDAAYARLGEHGVVAASVAPQTLPDWNPAAGGIRAFYFRDPDGHFLEILEFPPGKGDPRWHAGTGGKGPLFLGIDHTAIVVRDTEPALRFYRDELGLRVAGTSENYGPEQERLNNVSGAHLRITTLRAARGPGVELLEYLAPRDGRPMPPDTRVNDLWHWHINVVTNVGEAGATSVQRDPDGHALCLRPAQ